ncbi:MAG TPA: tRNA pseudouridine(38-40) synthase TruA [Acidobacteriota bacterium]|jgi:tRNA pseudouridine38-40 synthase
MPLECFKLTLEYDGTRYHGWQSQKNSRTIQDALIAAAREVLQVDVDVGGAGRTDAGVHALAQVAHLKFRVSSSASRDSGSTFRASGSGSRSLWLCDQLNRALPSDIVVLTVEKTDANFHARHDAVRRYYLYQVANRKTAFAKRYVWWVKESLNLAAMQHATEMLLGRHDFAAFGEKGGERKSTLVEVYECSLNATEELILIRIGASHFLWKLVRRLVGSLVEIGRGNLSRDAFAEMLEHKKGSAAPFTAPASGLFLQKVTYSEEEQPGELSPVMWV